MRVGALSVSSHAAGMSALWHDPDFEPVKRFETPLVQKNFDQLPLPTEQVELPDGVADPFAKLDAVYDAAAVQMDRGLKGAEFLHGKKAPSSVTPPTAALDAQPAVGTTPGAAPSSPSRVGADDPTRLVDRPRAPPLPQAQQVHQTTSTTLQRQEREHHRGLDAAAQAYQPGQTSSSTKTAASADAERAARQGAIDQATSLAATFAPMAASQVITATVQGPLPALAAQAAQAVEVAGAVASAGELALVGVNEGLKDTTPTNDDGAPRRGLRRR
jgi:hypothetical protein